MITRSPLPYRVETHDAATTPGSEAIGRIGIALSGHSGADAHGNVGTDKLGHLRVVKTQLRQPCHG